MEEVHAPDLRLVQDQRKVQLRRSTEKAEREDDNDRLRAGHYSSRGPRGWVWVARREDGTHRWR